VSVCTARARRTRGLQVTRPGADLVQNQCRTYTASVANVPARVSVTIPAGPLRELIESIRTPGSSVHSLAAELWGYDPAEGPASRVVMDMVFLGAGQLRLALDAESYHRDAQAHDPEREAWVRHSTVQFLATSEHDGEPAGTDTP
jgi:hypothetical protein